MDAKVSSTIERNLALELVRVTEAAALLSGRWMGRGDKIAADQAAVDAMRTVLNSIQMSAVVIIGEGEKDEAPMLYIGEHLGTGTGPELDIAVDPIDGTRLLSNGMPNALAVIAVADRGSMFASPNIMYMEKIATGPEARGTIDINAPVAENLARVAQAKGKSVADLGVVVLDRPRHDALIAEIRGAGARIRLIPDGDVAGAIMAAREGTGIDIMLGIGGAPEAVVAACALKSLGGDMQCRLWPRNDDERRIVQEQNIDTTRVLGLDDLVSSDNVFFAATGITDGDLLRGVHYSGEQATTQSLVTRSRSGTIRMVDAVHRMEKLSALSALPSD